VVWCVRWKTIIHHQYTHAARIPIYTLSHAPFPVVPCNAVRRADGSVCPVQPLWLVVVVLGIIKHGYT
jgi:hypothetical protein